jgi:hypothetical protein
VILGKFTPREATAQNLINAPAIGATVRSALLLDCHPDALVKSVRSFLKALNPAFILVGKFDLRPRAAACCPACCAGETHANNRNTGMMDAKRMSIPLLLKWRFFDIA